MENNIPDTELNQEDLEAAYQAKFGVGIPDLIIGVTREGVTQAFVDLLMKSGVLSEHSKVTGLLADVNFTGDGDTCPIAVYFDKVESAKGLN